MEVLHSIWQFIQNQILGMKWLNEVIGSGLSNLGVDTASRWGGSIQFFINRKSRPVLEKFFVLDTVCQKRQAYRATIQKNIGKY